MVSGLKSATARANGAKSRGPKTAATREISSRNSLGHGLTARNTILLQLESPDEFKEMLAEFQSIYRPANQEQKNLVDEMVAARWRLDRYCLIETALIDDEVDRLCTLPGNHPDPGIRLARAVRSLADQSGALSLMRRYQATLHRAYDKAYRTLRELQNKAEASTPKPPAPLKPAVVANPPVQNEPTVEQPSARGLTQSKVGLPKNAPKEPKPVLIHSQEQ